MIMHVLAVLCSQRLGTTGLILNGGTQQEPRIAFEGVSTWSVEYTAGVKKAKLDTWHDLVRDHHEHIQSVLDPDDMPPNPAMALRKFAASAIAAAGGGFYTLLTSVFLSPVSPEQKDHSVEVLASIAANAANPMIEEIHVLLEISKQLEGSDIDMMASVRAVEADPCLELKMSLTTLKFDTRQISKKLVCSRVTSIPFYSDLVKYANDKLRGRFVAIANGDIVFDLSLGKVNQDLLLNGTKVVVLSVKPAPYIKVHGGKWGRKNAYPNCAPVLRCNHGFIDHWLHAGNSWDAYLFQSPLPPMDLSHVEHPMNLPGAENSFAYTLYMRGGVRLENDCKNVHAFHWHCARKTHGSWEKYTHISPERLGNLMPSSFRANPWLDGVPGESSRVADEVEARLLCQEGTRTKLRDARSLFLFNNGNLTQYLCCPIENASCEQDWLDKLRNNPNHMDANSTFCQSPEDVTCIVYAGDKEGKALLRCPEYPIHQFGNQQRDECNRVFGRWWPFVGNSTLPIGGAMPEVSEISHAKFHRGDRLLHFAQGREGSTSLVKALRKKEHDLGFFLSGECAEGDPANKRDVIYHRDWRIGCKTHYPDLAYRFLDQVPVNTTTWLLTIVRNGLHQGVSDFFMTWYDRIWPGRNWTVAPRLDYENFLKLSNDELMDYYTEFLWVNTDWFQRFLTPLIGFDARTLKEPLSKDGYAFQQLRYRNGKTINLLVLRFEVITQWPAIMNKFFPLENSAFPHEVATTKEGWRAHQDNFKKFLCEENRLPTTLEESAKYENMEFYSDTEVIGFLDEMKKHCSALRQVPPIRGAPDALGMGDDDDNIR